MAKPLVVVAANSTWSIVRFRQGLLRGLEQAGYALAAVAPSDEYADRLPCPLLPIDMQRGGTNPLQDLRLYLALRAAYRRLRPAAVLHFTSKLNIYGTLACRSLGIPSLCNVSGLGSGFLGGGLVAGVQRLLYRIALRRASRVFFQNPEDREQFLQAGLVPERLAGLLPGSGVDLRFFSPRPPVQPSGFAFLFVGRLIKDKGIREYVEAARLVKSGHPEVRFWVAGELDAANPTGIRREVLQGWVEDGVIEYLGHLEDVRPRMAEAGCVVLPSYREGTSRTLLEAASMARPLIAADVPGCRQVVDDGVTGLLCRDRDSVDLAEKMRRLLALGQRERDLMGARGRAKMEREYGEALVAGAYLQALKAGGIPGGSPQ
jgi:glycosyltransferase involved in cell wall biosynthesis